MEERAAGGGEVDGGSADVLRCSAGVFGGLIVGLD